ncbi:protein of unknown function [Cupriavidus taiwanensis]|nr:protein of unknown function [Cupriavidus taiwanensis]
MPPEGFCLALDLCPFFGVEIRICFLNMRPHF